ncbi:Transmembrane protein 209 [Eumeta japonica]|uniref:Transmembrane protein 209 n=1 Tax=Eumeta variegata TaxID=151549 RepID=A0A4C1T333_EUMVA|nr:Transmembrane protein 209 [Eumeta japonica]
MGYNKQTIEFVWVPDSRVKRNPITETMPPVAGSILRNDLAKGSCIADYRWNSGSEYHGLKWDEHLPTDSAILFHFVLCLFDTQLMPLPQGGGRPFIVDML